MTSNYHDDYDSLVYLASIFGFVCLYCYDMPLGVSEAWNTLAALSRMMLHRFEGFTAAQSDTDRGRTPGRE